MSRADEEALHAALDAYDSGNLAQAEPVLRTLAARHPGSYEANEALGSLYAESGDEAHALVYLRRACLIAPRAALAHANLGAAYLKLSNTAGAIRELQTAASLDPSSLPTQSDLGQALLLAAHFDGAAQAFAAAAKLAPQDNALKYNLALALYQAGKEDRASDVLATIPAEAMTDQYHSLAGDADEKSGRFQQALLHFQAAARLNPSDPNLYALTTELLRHWTWPEAIEIANYGDRLYPGSSHFKMAAGFAYYAKGDYKPAVQVFSGLLQSDPENAQLADLLGRSCSLLADDERAACGGIYEYAERHPGNPILTTYAAVAILHEPQDKQDLEKAATMLRSAIAADPTYPEAYFQLGVLEQARLHWIESTAYLQKSIALRPKWAEAHYRLSRAYAHLGRREEAQAEIALQQTYSQESKQALNTKLQEVMKFVLKPS
ncbi:MAG TPA: tetratricopeptide repeat protein [Acidisarcina sp.]